MLTPPLHTIAVAVEYARLSLCSKSKRGVVVFERDTGELHGRGFNGLPGETACTGSSACREFCGRRCVHAEVRAIRDAVGHLAYRDEWELHTCDAVHVKIDEHGDLVAGGGPSCWQCSREVLDVGLGGFWLYEDCCPYMDARWVRYTAAEFHAATLQACGIP